MELYSHETYKGYHLFVEVYGDEDTEEVVYIGVAQYNGTTIYHSKSYISGNKAEEKLITLIDKDENDDCSFVRGYD